MNITNDQDMYLKGPMSELEFLEVLSKTERSTVEFADRTKSRRASSSLSFNSSGWIVLTYQDSGMVLLYDSVQNPSAYLRATGLEGRIVGRHNSNEWFLYK